MPRPDPLPLVARRAAWDRLWQILLAPLAESESRAADTPARCPRQAPDQTGDRR